jgi:hypothetical protein
VVFPTAAGAQRLGGNARGLSHERPGGVLARGLKEG